MNLLTALLYQQQPIHGATPPSAVRLHTTAALDDDTSLGDYQCGCCRKFVVEAQMHRKKNGDIGAWCESCHATY